MIESPDKTDGEVERHKADLGTLVTKRAIATPSTS